MGVADCLAFYLCCTHFKTERQKIQETVIQMLLESTLLAESYNLERFLRHLGMDNREINKVMMDYDYDRGRRFEHTISKAIKFLCTTSACDNGHNVFTKCAYSLRKIELNGLAGKAYLLC